MRTTIFRLLLSCLIAFLIPIGSHAGDKAEHQERLEKHYRLEKPEGDGPFPAVIMVSGCSGFEFMKGHYDAVQSQLVELGFVTLRVNYLAARNATTCWPDVPANDVADDICIAAEHLKQQTFVKKGAINVIGWSWGGAGAFRALRRTPSREPAQVDAVVAYYPHCNAARKWDSEVPVLVLAGAIDSVSPFKACETLFSYLPKRHKVTVRVYDDAHHCFDNFELQTEMQHFSGGTLGYNEAAAKSAWMEVTNFLLK